MTPSAGRPRGGARPALETLFLSTTPGLEPVLHAEAAALGQARAMEGGVMLTGPRGLHRHANLVLRTASRVLLELLTVRTDKAAILHEALRSFDFAPFLSKGAPLQLETIARGGLSERELRAAAIGLPLGGALLRLRSDPGGIRVSLDTSGELLYRRGYRQEVSRAPLRETLAAGMLALAQHRPEEPLWDPLCGSGTIVIEAALRSRGLPAGLQRRFAFEHFPSHEAARYAQERATLVAQAAARAPATLLGSDVNAGALGTARRNAGRAGVLADLSLLRHDATVPLPGPVAWGLAIANLPYGKRVGEAGELPALYGAIAAALRRSSVARVALLAHDPRAAQWLGFTPDHVHPVDNGGLACQLLVGRL